MKNKLVSAYNHSLTQALRPIGLALFSRGVYAQSSDDMLWHGMWVTFNITRGILVAQPNVGVFCPAAERMVSEGLKGNQSYRSYFGKLGGPILTRPLYTLVRSITGEDRMPPAYHVATVEKVGEVVSLMRDDFMRVAQRFLRPIDSMLKLRDHLMTDSATGARMYAISVTYLMDGHITSHEIDRVLGPQPNAMSREFAEYFKKEFANATA